ncbi:pyruvate kinase [Ereboglobus sp. PH5-5]|uniref:pyruvate kinase n=1 Tax=Ereboglobus sp. PH5-5 TaxID=2940529 RepID=UPI002405507C|nr:pyruvate kinase [Ereboglobus sp. PH5-5]MDF9833465.1 pyruvate kinase [Ereboglobus sp. PH5-5]
MNSSAASFRRTKIVVTIGPATESEEMLEKAIRAGADVFRLNMAHARHDWTRAIIRRIRGVSQRVGREVAIMMDIKGPEIRTGDVAAPIELKPGEIFDFTMQPGDDGGSSTEIRSVHVNYKDLVNDVKVGDTVLVDNGLIRLEVLEKRDARIRCRVLIPGELKSKRHINLPGVRVNLPSFTAKDKGDTIIGIEEGIDFVALSFVREAKDIETLRDFLKKQDSKAGIIAKIEDQSAIVNLDEIVMATDALMVARGDLGIECPVEELPIIQRKAVQACLRHGKAVIIATHMLESMITQPMPTRAEITDVANAVFELADCVMLSGETTVGKYPIESIEYLDKISRRIEQLETGEARLVKVEIPAIPEKLKVLRSAAMMAGEIDDARIITFTRQGVIARGLAALRPGRAPIIAFTPYVETLRQLRLLRSVIGILMPFEANPDDTIDHAIAHLKHTKQVDIGDKLVVVTDILSHDRLVDSVQLRTVR